MLPLRIPELFLISRRFVIPFIISFVFAVITNNVFSAEAVEYIKYNQRVRDFSAKDKLGNLWIDSNNEKLKTVDIKIAGSTKKALSLPVNFPLSKTIWLDKDVLILDYSIKLDKKPTLIMELTINTFVPKTATGRIQAAILLKDKDGIFYTQPSSNNLVAGKWNKLRFNLIEDFGLFSAKGHQGKFSLYQLSNMERIGFTFWGSDKFVGNILIEKISTTEVKAINYHDKLSTAITKIHTTKPQKNEKFEIDIAINRDIINPFNQAEIEIYAQFKHEKTQKIYTVPAFYYQDYLRKDNGSKYGYTPYGKGYFKIRFAPPIAGKYSYVITSKYVNPFTADDSFPIERSISQKKEINVMPSSNKGFVRVSKKDYRFFEFQNGDFFYPIGHNFRSPWDLRDWRKILKPIKPDAPKPIDKGFKKYEDIIPKMAMNGENFAEVWMSSWWLALEWTKQWKGYYGLLRYNTENAWKLDKLIELCKANNIYIQLVIDNHGKAAMHPQVDAEWNLNPYNQNADGRGFLKIPQQFFTDENAKLISKNQYRYIIGRWGYSTNIFSFELWSELDLIGNIKGRHRNIYASNGVRAWHQEMSNYIKNIDNENHLITTHYSGDYRRIDSKMFNLKELDFVACDAYHPRKQTLLNMLTKSYRFTARFKKPSIITEFGGDWNGGSWELLEADLHSGLWTTWILNGAGTPLFWWFEHIDRAKLYFHFKSFQKFIQGEDLRCGVNNFQILRPTIIDLSAKTTPDKPKRYTNKKVAAIASKNGKNIFCWIYDIKSLQKKIDYINEDYQLIIKNINNGKYKIEFWNTWTGNKILSTDANITDNILEIKLPNFKSDIAAKIKLR